MVVARGCGGKTETPTPVLELLSWGWCTYLSRDQHPKRSWFVPPIRPEHRFRKSGETCRSLWVSTPPTTCRLAWSLTSIPSLLVRPCFNGFARPSAWTRQSRDQMVRPFSGHRHRRGKASPQAFPGGRRVQGKTRVGRPECGSDHIETHCGASLPSGRLVLESDRPEAGDDLLTVGVEDFRPAVPEKRFL
jgi:hypothetical protein